MQPEYLHPTELERTYHQTEIFIHSGHIATSTVDAARIIEIEKRQQHDQDEGQQLKQLSKSTRLCFLLSLLLLLSGGSLTLTTTKATALWHSSPKSKSIGIDMKATRSAVHSTATTGHASSSKKHVENVFGAHFLSSSSSVTEMPGHIGGSSTSSSIVRIFFAVPIVNGSFLRIRQGGIRQTDRFEGFVRLRSSIFVRVQFQRQFAVGFFNLCFVGALFNSQYTIVRPSPSFFAH